MFISHFPFFFFFSFFYSGNCLFLPFVYLLHADFWELIRPKGNLQGKVTPKATMGPRTKHHLQKVLPGLATPHDDLDLPTLGSKGPRLVRGGVGSQSWKDRGQSLVWFSPEMREQQVRDREAWHWWPQYGRHSGSPLEGKESGHNLSDRSSSKQSFKN